MEELSFRGVVQKKWCDIAHPKVHYPTNFQTPKSKKSFSPKWRKRKEGVEMSLSQRGVVLWRSCLFICSLLFDLFNADGCVDELAGLHGVARVFIRLEQLSQLFSHYRPSASQSAFGLPVGLRTPSQPSASQSAFRLPVGLRPPSRPSDSQPAFGLPVALLCYRIIALSRYHIIALLRDCVIALSRCHVVALSHYCVIALSHYCVIALSHYCIITLSHYCVIALSHYHVITLSRYCIIALLRYRVIITCS